MSMKSDIEFQKKTTLSRQKKSHVGQKSMQKMRKAYVEVSAD